MIDPTDEKLIRFWFSKFVRVSIGSKTLLEDCYKGYCEWSVLKMRRPYCSKRAFFKLFRQIIIDQDLTDFISFSRSSKVFVQGLDLITYVCELD